MFVARSRLVRSLVTDDGRRGDRRACRLGRRRARRIATQTGVELRYRDGGRAIPYGDPLDIERVVANLVDTALRYIPPGGSADLSCQRSRTGLTVIVRETGVGIAEVDRTRLFERFWVGDPARGHGAGSRERARACDRTRLARHHGGEVTVTSTLGTGSAFTLELRARPPRATLDALSLCERWSRRRYGRIENG